MQVKNSDLILGTIFTGVLGVINHFLYEWSNYNKLVALFCPVNESTWEHLKLLFFPFLLWLIISCFAGRNGRKKFLGNAAFGCFSGMTSIVVLFYTYTGILGYFVDFINIAIYFIGVGVCFSMLWFLNKRKKHLSNFNGAVFFIVMTVLFFLFTFFPPSIGLFIPPL